MRAFVAVWPSAEVVAALSAFERPAVAGARWTTADQWHVTLRFLGSVGEEDVEPLSGALDGLASWAPVSVVLAPATACFGRSVLHVPVSGLADLAGAVARASAGFGSEPVDERPFAGHITLARARDRRRGDLRALAGRPVGGSFVASEVTLVRSRTDPKGARYEVIHRVPLSG